MSPNSKVASYLYAQRPTLDTPLQNRATSRIIDNLPIYSLLRILHLHFFLVKSYLVFDEGVRSMKI